MHQLTQNTKVISFENEAAQLFICLDDHRIVTLRAAGRCSSDDDKDESQDAEDAHGLRSVKAGSCFFDLRDSKMKKETANPEVK